MGKKKRKQNRPATNAVKPALRDNRGRYLRQTLVAVIAAVILAIGYNLFDGYRWVVEGLILKNLQVIRQYPDLSIEQKWAAKLGFDYAFLDYTKKNTPDDAVILFPPNSALFPANGNSKFKPKSQSVKNKAWATYFLYPRRIVYEYESGINPLFDEFDYVAVVNGWGYQYLNYIPLNKVQYQVLPVNVKSEQP